MGFVRQAPRDTLGIDSLKFANYASAIKPLLAGDIADITIRRTVNDTEDMAMLVPIATLAGLEAGALSATPRRRDVNIVDEFAKINMDTIVENVFGDVIEDGSSRLAELGKTRTVLYRGVVPPTPFEVDLAHPLVTGAPVLAFNTRAEAADGSITTVAKASYTDGEIITIPITDTVDVVLEFDDNATTVAGNIPINLTPLTSADEVRDAIISAIATIPGAPISAADGGAATVDLVHNNPGAAANRTITTDGPGAVAGFANGADSGNPVVVAGSDPATGIVTFDGAEEGEFFELRVTTADYLVYNIAPDQGTAARLALIGKAHYDNLVAINP